MLKKLKQRLDQRQSSRQKRRNANANLARLPTEITVLILQYATADDPEIVHKDHSIHYQLLRSISLVARNLREPAQLVLWVNVVLFTEAGAQKWLNSPLAGVYPTQSLVIDGPVWRDDGVKTDTAKRVLLRCNGASNLELNGFGESHQFRFTYLCVENLRSITSLTLDSVWLLATDPIESSQQPAFSLQSLKLFDYSSNYNHRLMFFFSPSLTTFQYICQHDKHSSRHQLTDFIRFLSTAGPNLHSLALIDYRTDILHRKLLPTFSYFTQLQQLHLHPLPSQLMSAAELLPIPLDSLTLETRNASAEETVRTLQLVTESHSLRSLAKLMMPSENLTRLMSAQEGAELLETLRRKSVVVLFGKPDSECVNGRCVPRGYCLRVQQSWELP